MTTETTSQTTLRQALRAARADLAGVDYISGHREYRSDRGWLHVRNAPSSDGGLLLGVFEAVLIGPDGRDVQKYKM